MPGWRAVVASLATFCIGALVAVALVWWLVPSPPSQDGGTDTIAAAWNRTITQLDIEPLFPPEEDVYVGDVFVVVVGGDPTQIGRMVKVWHVDMSEDLEQAYAGMPLFEKLVSTLPPVATEAAQASGQTPGFTLFRSSAPPRDLALVAFPGFTVRHARNARAGVSAGIGGLLGMFGVGRDSQEMSEFQITSTATYGVPSMMATSRLAQLCTDPFTRQICTPKVARRELSMVVGRKAEETNADGAYALDVELILIGRVYLTRSIAQHRDANSAVGAQARLAARLQTLAKQSAAVADGPVGTTQVATTDPGTAALRKALDDTQKQLASLSQEVSAGLPGGAVSYGASDGSTVALQQNFERPVVIGYRAVRTMLPYPESSQ